MLLCLKLFHHLCYAMVTMCILINYRTGINKLIDRDGWFDKYFGIGREGLLQLIQKA